MCSIGPSFTCTDSYSVTLFVNYMTNKRFLSFLVSGGNTIATSKAGISARENR
ncbi:hypothetical protein VCR29J2_30079 [Vibrio coralliirubri]|nr:hypothetical protein VCR29J2_30079 [Vibrio coralliirubri]